MSEGSKTRWIWPVAIGVAIVALAVIALVREPVALDPDTPEGTVQIYLQAISDEEYDKAFELLDPDSFEGCAPAHIARHSPSEPFSATLGSSSGSDIATPVRPPPEPDHSLPDDVVWVDVTLRFGTGGPFGSSWESWEQFVLFERDGFWWITGEPWPYFVWECREEGF